MLCQFAILQYLNKLSLVCSIVRIGLFISPCQSLSISMTGIDYVSHHHKKLNWLIAICFSDTVLLIHFVLYVSVYYHPIVTVVALSVVTLSCLILQLHLGPSIRIVLRILQIWIDVARLHRHVISHTKLYLMSRASHW